MSTTKARLVHEATQRAARRRDTAAAIAAAKPTAALTLAIARDLTSRRRPASAEVDACLRTHVQVRIAGSDIVHRLDVRGQTSYRTGCGEQITKTAGVLTAADVDCAHHGCGVTA